MRDSAGRKVETAVEARAGFLDRPVLVVLCTSLALGVAGARRAVARLHLTQRVAIGSSE